MADKIFPTDYPAQVTDITNTDKILIYDASGVVIGYITPKTLAGDPFLRADDMTGDNTIKRFHIGCYNYDIDEEQFLGIHLLAAATNNYTRIGGGRPIYNASTIVSIYTAPDQSTLDGTEQIRIENDGGFYAYNLLGSAIGANPAVWFNVTTKEFAYDTSAERYKENIHPAELSDVEYLYQIPIKKYDRKDKSRKDEIGIIADDLESIKPDLICYSEKNFKERKKIKDFNRENPENKKELPEPEYQVESYGKLDMIPSIIKCLQLQRETIQLQKQEIENLKARIEILENK